MIDQDSREDIFARVPQMAGRIDPILRQLDPLLDDDAVYQAVRADFSRRSARTAASGRPSTPVEVRLAHAAAQTSLCLEF